VNASGAPTYDTLAETSVPYSSVPLGDSTITGTFANPATVVAGQQYGLVMSRPGGDILRFGQRNNAACSGQEFSASPPGPFLPFPPTSDWVFATFVLENDSPETAITAAPKDKTRKRKATFEFVSDEPGSTFE